MRFLGNKESLAQTIKEFIFLHVPHIDNHTVLFDAFCGTGSVSDAFKSIVRLLLTTI